MKKLLMMEGNTADKRALGDELGVRSSSEIYTISIKSHFPDIQIDVVNGADEDWSIPSGNTMEDYDGFVICGSSLHAYDLDFAVTNQIELTAKAGQAGLPIFGSCWGLQIAVMAAGGLVEYNAHGREVGIARKIVPNDIGRTHPMLAGKGEAFDAPCIHYDEVTRLPENAVLLASNAHSKVQAAVVPLHNSEVWAVQYHPEFDIQQLVQLYTLYADDMVEQGFFANKESLENYKQLLSGLIDNPDNMGLAWQLGIDRDITADAQRRAEIINWINSEIC